MAEATGGRVAVTLNVEPALEERIVDWLLSRPELATFESRAVHAHGMDSRGLSVAEQVSGRQRRVEVTFEVEAGAVDRWLQELASAFGATDIAYRLTPVLLSGLLRERVVSG